MNTRIYELAKEADEYADAALSPGEFHPDWHDVRDVRFAILIVQECISLIEPVKGHREDAAWGCIGGEEDVELLDGAVRQIKEHFGVE